MNQRILQPFCTYVHYSLVYRICYNTESSYEPPLHYYHFVDFPRLSAHLQPSDPVDFMPLVQ
jgi:hypothetical protein